MADITEKLVTLPYGCNRAVPDNCRVAWGARLIFPNDLVWDRQGCEGGIKPEREELLKWLGLRAGDEARANAKALAQCCQMTPGSDETFLLYEDERGMVMGSPQKSYGHMYIAAWLHEHCS